MKSIEAWLSEYGESHQNETNKAIHWICVPTIFFSVVGLLYTVKLPVRWLGGEPLPLAVVVLALAVLYYLTLSRTLWIGMLLFGGLCLWLCRAIEASGVAPLWAVSLGLFTVAWIGQFYGHKIEGKKPSFFKDLQFLLIGPAWLMSFIYQRMGVRP